MTGEADTQQNITMAVLKNDVEYIKKEVGSIGGKLDILEKNYIRRSEVEAIVKDADGMYEKLEKEIRGMELGLEVFKTQVKTWGAAGILFLGIVQYAVGKLL